MADSKKYDGSQWEHSLRKLTTATDTITTLPADLYADGNNATVGLVGNMSQTGTPTPQNPIQPSETGERTENLFDGQYYNAYVTANGEYVSPDNTVLSIIVKCEPNTQYTIKQISPTAISSHKWRIAVFTSQPINGSQGTVLVNDDSLSESTIITMSDSKYLVIYYSYANTPTRAPFMINTGSTALPYEPYGYKIPISNGQQTTNIYLGSTQTVRLIKKVVFDGTENWEGTDDTISKYLRFYIYDYKLESGVTCMSTHYSGTNNIVSGDKIPNNSVCFYNAKDTRILYLKGSEPITLADFKAYLAQQYAAGTPVTVWYVLATEETGIVNEPVRKIGNYADTVSGITIPTIAGKDTFDVETTLKPSEVTVNYKGWHTGAVHERENGAWT